MGPRGAGRTSLAVCLLLGALLLGSCTGGLASGGGGGGGGTRRGGTGNPMDVVPRFVVANESQDPRNETVLASLPFPMGGVRDLSTLGVKGLATAWHVLQRWPDGSVRLAQAQSTDELDPGEWRAYEVVRDVQTLQGPFERNPWVRDRLPQATFFTVVTDRDGIPYYAVVTGEGEVLQETYLARTRRHRLYHRNPNPSHGIARDFLSSTIYTTEFRDLPIATVDVVVGNDYLGSDNPGGSTDPNLYPLGDVAFSSVEVGWRNVELAPVFKDQNHIGDSYTDGQGNRRLRLLDASHLADGATKRWRFLVLFDHPNGEPEQRQKWRRQLTSQARHPLRALATLETWQASGALGLHGGPVTGPADARSRSDAALGSWRGRTSEFGPFGPWGDVKATATTGTPRNHPVSPQLAQAVQGENPPLLEALEGMAWQQALRTYHLWGLQVGAEDDIYLWDGVPLRRGGRDLSPDSLGRRALYGNDPYTRWRQGISGQVDHGWFHYDHEHWSTDLLFDYWSVTGDHWAREELRNLGESLKGLMRLRRFFTSSVQPLRAEGWCMTGFVHAYLATGDESVKTYAIRRVREVVDPQRHKEHPSKAMAFQRDYPGTTFPMPHAFCMPWQHAAVIYGYLAAWRFFEEELFLEIAEDCVTALEYGWVTNFQDPHHGFVANGLRYYVPVEYNSAPIPPNYWDSTAGIGVRWGDSPLGGAHSFFISALYLLARDTPDQSVHEKALKYGDILLGPNFRNNNALWSKWASVIPDDMLPQ